MPDVNNGLLIEEYKSCRELILKNIDIMEKNEVFVTGACAAIFVFSLQSSDHVVATITSWLPPVITALGWLRFYGLDNVIDKINGRLIEIESAHPPLHWTTYYRAHNKPKILKRTRHALWIVLGLSTYAGALYVTIWH
jgi:hypothetical protein